jgi:hypothetical protein
MSNDGPIFELPKNIDRYLAALSKLYAQDGKKTMQSIIVNARIRVVEEWTSDNWDGGIFGHAIYMALPEALYLNAVKNKDFIQDQLKEDLNKLHNIRGEFIAQVFLEMDVSEDRDWRKESGLLLTGERIIAPEAANRVWGDEGYRVFLSHKDDVKKEAAELKDKLKVFGISGFVAHQDIEPTQEWQDEIENALFSMDAFVALMTENFHNSNWTDQEVGVAFARDVPIISIKLGKDPYGFIGKFQALSCSLDTAPNEIVKILIKHERMVDAYIKAVQNCHDFNHGNTLSELLPFIDRLSDQQVNGLISAFNRNSQVHASYGFNGDKPSHYGDGLIPHLNRLTGKTHKFSKYGEIEVVP